MDYNSLYDKIDQYKSKKNVYPYLEAYLTKAKKENNLTEIITGYKNYIYEVEYSQRLIYADSMIAVAELTKNNEEIGSAILTKGIIYYSEKEHNKALDCYLTANKLIVSTNNDYLKFKTQYNIAHVKYYLGFYNEAISLFLKCSDFFQTKNPRAYINCLHSLTLCYTRIGNYQASAETNKLAIDKSKKYQDFSMIPYLNHSAGINDYFRKSYKDGLTKLKSSIPELIKQKDLANLSVAYFYIASIYWDTGKRELAFPYLLKVDQIFSDKKYIRPDLRKNYEMIIDYYKGKSDNDSVLLYMTKLLEADKIIETNSKYLSTKITKEYDTVKLIDETKKIKDEAKNEKAMKIGLFVIVLFLLPASIYLLYKNRKLTNSKRHFELFKKNDPKEDTLGSSKIQRPNIPQELEEELLTKLVKFETNLGFLKKDLKIEKLATSFNTNYKYLSQIINFHKGLSYPDYMSDLRISYIIKKLEEDPKLRKYSNNALAEESGFKNAPSFANAFKNKTGMSVNFFIDQIK
ncbi:AraC family transcriptional regulator [Flavobacterium aquiphilum]|uniref:AraC family transcriptional regulator n=1 Tax=Flavobacterium aquiphilum TaxID=3003261 RepID=UPI002480885A|nr:AraC family transcriptional regulator [Flavobacterium aquiphilum]